jgi:threonine synthase
MKFYSTKNKNHSVTLKDAVIRGLAPDNGLYMPEQIPQFPKVFFDSISDRSFQENSFEIAKHLLGHEIPEADLRRMVNHTVSFDAPLVEVEKNVFALELFHGPTLAFKDFGARFMSQLLGYFSRQQEKGIVILVATSGDTGSAVANGFLGVDGTRVVVLYPSGKVSDIQEKQFTTLGKNITALEVEGTFDDCQRLVKQAFQDENLRDNYFLTSANSINIARLIPQSFYYFHAYAQAKDRSLPLIFSVPSGNFGNLTGGLIAKRMGLPVEHFVVATNVNDVVPEFLQTKVFQPRPSVATISNAMDVGNPSNFDRMMDLYDEDFETFSVDVSGYRITDEETQQAMKSVWKEKGYILDPHGAVAYCGLQKYSAKAKEKGNRIFLETAHPGKFFETVERTLNQKIQLPLTLEKFQSGKKLSIKMDKDYNSFKRMLAEIL